MKLPEAQVSLDPVPMVSAHAFHLANPPASGGRGKARSRQNGRMSFHLGTKDFLRQSAVHCVTWGMLYNISEPQFPHL